MNPPDNITISVGALVAICSVMTTVGALGTGYLRLYMAKALHEMRDSMVDQMRKNFVLEDVNRPALHEIRKQVTRNEARVEKLSDRVDVIEIHIAKIDPKAQ